MRNRVAIKWARNPWLAASVLVAFFAYALTPPGFMPGPGGLIICRGYAPDAAASIPHDVAAMPMAGTNRAGMDTSNMDMSGMDMSGSDMEHPAGHSNHDGTAPGDGSMGMCPFAAAATAMVSAQATHAAVFAHFVSMVVDVPPQPFVPRGTIVPTRLPRGPPVPA